MSLKHKFIAFTSLLLLLFTFSPALASADCSPDTSSTKSAITGGINCAAGAGNQSPASLDTTIHNILEVLSTVVGIAAIFMIIVAGLRYITSAGDAEKVKSAKRGLLYAIIGLVIVALAQVIVYFVLTEAAKPTTNSTDTTSKAKSSTSKAAPSSKKPLP